jgi:hypothetical protein
MYRAHVTVYTYPNGLTLLPTTYTMSVHDQVGLAVEPFSGMWLFQGSKNDLPRLASEIVDTFDGSFLAGARQDERFLAIHAAQKYDFTYGKRK